MPNVGSAGQRKLVGAKVLVVGAGGLGSPVSLYLALAGVGTIGIVDFDVVDVSNLQRQILHTNADVGRRKVISAKETLQAHNPEVNVITHEEPINADNAMDIIPNYDIVVNGQTTSQRVIWLTTPRISPASRLWMGPSWCSMVRLRHTSRGRVATAACSQIRRRQEKSRTAPKPA
ncbi:Probable adenylyltransferase/sulfurtransferase MoeZ [Geodia barretti]|uniref:Probable adenylyltransferase/sulfurtransferase MoeZ n=1 Tax=Geodia barretti TaxID=519541 RepID=A0AA35R1J9_GEOBA|nr:Probable adenylyltransferase/sulfurtransferase MoeZ [Geodia barretti]